ncbi:MAG: hypothetical protein WBP45_15045 [Daejeonella sp.]
MIEKKTKRPGLSFSSPMEKLLDENLNNNQENTGIENSNIKEVTNDQSRGGDSKIQDSEDNTGIIDNHSENNQSDNVFNDLTEREIKELLFKSSKVKQRIHFGTTIPEIQKQMLDNIVTAFGGSTTDFITNLIEQFYITNKKLIKKQLENKFKI